MIRRAAPLLLAVFAISALPGAELVVRDIRLGVGTRPLDFDFAYTGVLTSASGTDGFDAALGLEAGGRWSFARPGDALGLVVGADLALDGWSYGGSDGLATSWLRLCAGPGYALNDRVTLSAEIGVQYGMSALALPETASAPAFEASGSALAYDLRVGGNWLATRRFGVGLFAGWLIASHDLSGDADLTIDQSGWFAGVEAVWRFTDAPPRLE